MRRPPPVSIALALVLAMTPTAGAEAFRWSRYQSKPDAWFRGEEGAEVARNLRSYQSDAGDWPKNLDTSARPYTGDRSRLHGTFDNGATVGETRFLARAFVAAGRSEDREAVLKALDHILAAQYPTGGWPQTSPPGKGYARHITFNDDTMINLMELLRDVANSDAFAFVDAPRREAARRAFDAGLACILRCRVVVHGKPTVWCAQHDEVTYEPRGARTFELASLSGSESARILALLMSLDDPSPEVVRAVHAGARWFEASKLLGIRIAAAGGDRKVVEDPNAPPLWARFYDLESNRPFFCDRDGVKKWSLAEIGAERRNGYAWYGAWGQSVASRYASWSKAHPEGATR